MIVHPTWAWIERRSKKRARRHFPLPLSHRAPLTPEGWFGERASREAGAFTRRNPLCVRDRGLSLVDR